MGDEEQQDLAAIGWYPEEVGGEQHSPAPKGRVFLLAITAELRGLLGARSVTALPEQQDTCNGANTENKIQIY